MTKEEIKQRLAERIDEDDQFAEDIGDAIELEDDVWLAELIGSVIGMLIDLASSAWEWLKRLFS